MSAGELHPEMTTILEAQRRVMARALESMPIADARAQFVRNNETWNQGAPELASADITLGAIPCRMLGTGTDKVLLFVHGGGWTFGSPETHDRFARLLAATTGALVIVPDYRLAPEHPAPAAIDDVLSVVAALDTVAASDAKLVLCGDSAGATIALAAALERPARPIALLSLLYGCFAPLFETPSQQRNGDGRYGLSTQRMRWYWSNWLGSASDPRAAPLDADLAGLPRCHLVAAGLDPLCDDSLMLADHLARDGVECRLDIVPGVVHGFLQMTGRLRPARNATAMISAEIIRAFDDNEGETR